MHKFAVILGDGDRARRSDECTPPTRVPGLVRMTRNDVVRVVPREHVPVGVEGISAVEELWCTGTSPVYTLDALRVAYAGRAVVQICWIHERTIFERPGEGLALVKRLSFLQRKATLSRSEFCAYWHDVHAPMAECHHHVARYVQNHVVDAGSADGPFDGVGEFQITDLEGMQADYETEAGRSMRGDVLNFAASVSTYLVRSREMGI